jgi:hypothetical protein
VGTIDDDGPGESDPVERSAVFVRRVRRALIVSTFVAIGGLFSTDIAALTIVLILAACWVLADTSRAARLALIIRAVRGESSEPTPGTTVPDPRLSTASPQAVRGRGRMLAKVLRRRLQGVGGELPPSASKRNVM